MIITARYDGVCGTCGGAIGAGERVEWSRGSRARHASCGAGQPAATTSTPPRTYGARVQAARTAWGRRRGMGPGHGQAAKMAGYSSYCTDSDSCRCYDCAS